MGRHLGNNLLSRLDKATFAALEPNLTVKHLKLGDVLNETHGDVRLVYFPLGGIVSCVVQLVGGGAIETGMIGNDGQFGGGAALDRKVSLNHVVMQVPGEVSVIDADRFRKLAQDHRSLREITIGYEQFFLAQVQQTAACNAAHNVPMRTCKWLLRMQKLAGNELPLTQEFLAQMMGVQRSSVSSVAAELQRVGMISYSRGKIIILDLPKIKDAACECNDSVNSHYVRLFGARHTAMSA
jgi:CRP-like cAMP-binding protein